MTRENDRIERWERHEEEERERVEEHACETWDAVIAAEQCEAYVDSVVAAWEAGADDRREAFLAEHLEADDFDVRVEPELDENGYPPTFDNDLTPILQWSEERGSWALFTPDDESHVIPLHRDDVAFAVAYAKDWLRSQALFDRLDQVLAS